MSGKKLIKTPTAMECRLQSMNPVPWDQQNLCQWTFETWSYTQMQNYSSHNSDATAINFFNYWEELNFAIFMWTALLKKNNLGVRKKNSLHAEWLLTVASQRVITSACCEGFKMVKCKHLPWYFGVEWESEKLTSGFLEPNSYSIVKTKLTSKNDNAMETFYFN